MGCFIPVVIHMIISDISNVSIESSYRNGMKWVNYRSIKWMELEWVDYRGTPRFINMQHDNSMATLLYANHKILFLI